MDNGQHEETPSQLPDPVEPQTATTIADSTDLDCDLVTTFRAGHRLVPSVLVLAAAGCVSLAVASLWWPIYLDSPILEYVAWLVRSGYRPYADIFEMNFPGTYIFHILGQDLFGMGDLSFRVRDLLLLGFVLLAVRQVGRLISVRVGTIWPVLLSFLYLTAGPTQSLQRDWVMMALEIGAVALILRKTQRLRMTGISVGGLLLGFAVMIKPTALIMLAAVPLLLFIVRSDHEMQEDRANLRTTVGSRLHQLVVPLIAIVAGMGVSIGLVIGWLILVGGGPAFLDMVRDYTPLYTRLDGMGIEYPSMTAALFGSAFTSLLNPFLILASCTAILVASRARSQRATTGVLVVGILLVVGYLQALLGIKNWFYHYWLFNTAGIGLVAIVYADVWAGRLEVRDKRWIRVVSALSGLLFLIAFAGYLLVAFELGLTVMVVDAVLFIPVCMLAAHDFVGLWPRFRPVSRRVGQAAAVPILACTFLAVGMISVWSIGHPIDSDVGPGMERVEGVAKYLRVHAKPDDRVLILDTTDGAANALLRAHLRPATNFLYDFHFFHDVDMPEIRHLRSQLIDELNAHPPRYIVRSDSSWSHRRSLRSFRSFPELEEFMERYQTVFRVQGSRTLTELNPGISVLELKEAVP